MVNEFFTLIRDSEAKTKNPVNCLPGVLDTVICAESAHLKKKKKVRSQEISSPRAVSLSLECGQHLSGSSEVEVQSCLHLQWVT